MTILTQSTSASINSAVNNTFEPAASTFYLFYCSRMSLAAAAAAAAEASSCTDIVPARIRRDGEECMSMIQKYSMHMHNSPLASRDFKDAAVGALSLIGFIQGQTLSMVADISSEVLETKSMVASMDRKVDRVAEQVEAAFSKSTHHVINVLNTATGVHMYPLLCILRDWDTWRSHVRLPFADDARPLAYGPLVHYDRPKDEVAIISWHVYDAAQNLMLGKRAIQKAQFLAFMTDIDPSHFRHNYHSGYDVPFFSKAPLLIQLSAARLKDAIDLLDTLDEDILKSVVKYYQPAPHGSSRHARANVRPIMNDPTLDCHTFEHCPWIDPETITEASWSAYQAERKKQCVKYKIEPDNDYYGLYEYISAPKNMLKHEQRKEASKKSMAAKRALEKAVVYNKKTKKTAAGPEAAPTPKKKRGRPPLKRPKVDEPPPPLTPQEENDEMILNAAAAAATIELEAIAEEEDGDGDCGDGVFEFNYNDDGEYVAVGLRHY